MLKINIKNTPLLIALVLTIITLITNFVFKDDSTLTEVYYSNGFYPNYVSYLSYFSNLFPFSLADIFYIFLILFFPVSIILVLFKKLKFTQVFKHTIIIILFSYVLFYWFWGFNYYRQNIHDRLDFTKSTPNTKNFKQVFDLVISKTNEAYFIKDSLSVLNYQIIHENTFLNLNTELKLNYPTGKRRVKYITFSDFFAKATIGGYYGPFFNEVHVNKYLSKWDIPMVVAHEMSHQFGITSEAEANFYAWRVCSKSEDNFANYSGWFYILNKFLYQAGGIYSKEELLRKIKPEVISDIRSRRMHWEKLRNDKIDRVANKVNDAYLKSNNVKKGIDDYNAVVQLIIDFYLSNNRSFDL